MDFSGIDRIYRGIVTDYRCIFKDYRFIFKDFRCSFKDYRCNFIIAYRLNHRTGATKIRPAQPPYWGFDPVR